MSDTATPETDKASPVFVIFASGNRSSEMTGLLRDAGYDAFSIGRGHRRLDPLGPPVEDWHDHDRPDHRPHRHAHPG